mmetsp:Transcript_22981/g.35789  ORF Transcript_22981/g.35789 Transcript_22981/m.35789 type:complete len:562 (-) Transcript_22981:65-1750(-)
MSQTCNSHHVTIQGRNEQGEMTLSDTELIWTNSNPKRGQRTREVIKTENIIRHSVNKRTADKFLWKVEFNSGKPSDFVFSFTGPEKEREREFFKNKLSGLLKRRNQQKNHHDLKSRKRKAEVLSEEDIQHRAAILAGKRNIKEIHNALISKNILNEAEFWDAYQNDLSAEKGSVSHLSVGMINTNLTDHEATAELSDTKKFKLNASVIQQIFVKYPSVRREYQQNVPHKIDELTFWNRYFRAQFYHREGSTAALNNDAVILSRIQADEDRVTRAAPLGNPQNPALNLFANEADEYWADEDREDDRLRDCLPLIRKTNFHGTSVLSKHSAIPPLTECTRKDSFVDDLVKNKSDLEQKQIVDYRKTQIIPTEEERGKMISKDIVITDLQTTQKSDFSHLDLQPKRSTYEEMASMQGGRANPQKAGVQPTPFSVLTKRWVEAREDPKRKEIPFVHEDVSKQVVAVINGPVKGNKATNTVGPNTKAEIIEECRRTNEYLRHFWGCFPLNDVLSKEKAKALKKTLESQEEKIKKLRCQSNQSAMLQAIQDVILRAFEVAKQNGLED